MRLHASAITLLVVGAATTMADAPPGTWRLLHTEVLPVTAPGGCPITHFFAERYLVPTIPGAVRVAYLCHETVSDLEILAMQEAAVARNEARVEMLVRFAD